MEEFTEKCFARNLKINMNYLLKSVEDAQVKNKKVLVRCDFDSPIDEAGNILDETRLISSISTIEYLLEEGAIVILIGHLGRPNGQNLDFSLEKTAQWYGDKFPGSSIEEENVGYFSGWKIRNKLFILENLRFEDEEEKNDLEFAKKLASVADIYVNEAFGVSHRMHASIVGLPKLLPSYAGFHLIKEVKVLSFALNNPKKPFTVVIGGAKIETKLPLISRMEKNADYVLVAGEIAYKARVDLSEKNVIIGKLNNDDSDVIDKSLDEFLDIIKKSKMIIWNGPIGNLEKGKIDSTLKIAKAIGESGAYSIVGGGDTVAFLNKNNLSHLFNFVSVGGGAMLEFLSREELVGLKVLQNNP